MKEAHHVWSERNHNPARRSWVETANAAGTDFPIQNLPYGVSVAGGERRVGVAIGDQILDLTQLEADGILTPGGDAKVFGQGIPNPLMALSQNVWIRPAARSRLLDSEGGTARSSWSRRPKQSCTSIFAGLFY